MKVRFSKLLLNENLIFYIFPELEIQSAISALFAEKESLEQKIQEYEEFRFSKKDEQGFDPTKAPAKEEVNSGATPVYISKFMAQKFIEINELECVIEAAAGKRLGGSLIPFKDNTFESCIKNLAVDLEIRGIKVAGVLSQNNRGVMTYNTDNLRLRNHTMVIRITEIAPELSITDAVFRVVNIAPSTFLASLPDLFDNVTNEVANSIISYRNLKRNEKLNLDIERLSLLAERERLRGLLNPG